MKPLVLLLAVSVAANAALLAVVWLRHAAPNGPAPAVNHASSPSANIDPALRAALASGDATALAAAGCPPEVARALAVGRAFHRQQERLRALRAPSDRTLPYWRREFGPDGISGMPREARSELMKIQRDYQDEIHEAGEEPMALFGGSASLLTFLPADTREKLRRIERDYSEMNGEIFAEAGNLQLPSDKEKMKLLQTERERDIAALLGPEVYAQYQMRVSQSAYTVRNRFGSGINTEEEYAAVYALQKSFDDRFNGPNPPAGNNAAARNEADARLQQDVATLLGPDGVEAVRREADSDYRTLTSLTKRLDLPASTPEAVLALRNAYAAESVQINANSNLPPEERSTQLKALAARAQADLERTLGTEGGQAFAGRANWMQALKNGSAFSTTPVSTTPFNPAFTVIPPHK